jgi:membrane protease YdiL (CAAX protease family)
MAIAVFVAVALWLNGWFYPLILLPFIYVKWVAKKPFGWIGFRKEAFRYSAFLGVLSAFAVILTWYPIFVFYLSLLENMFITLYIIFTDVMWCPFYEEVTYRGFILAHLSTEKGNVFSVRNLAANLIQTSLFLSVHHKFIASGTPLFFVPVFFLGFATGMIFLKTRNIYGCIVSHSLTNGIAHLVRMLLFEGM